MPKFPQSFIDEVRAAADIVAVIQDYVSLRKAGASYKGLCPFHSEKSPSFTVNRDKGFFHCFGCKRRRRRLQVRGAAGEARLPGHGETRGAASSGFPFPNWRPATARSKAPPNAKRC